MLRASDRIVWRMMLPRDAGYDELLQQSEMLRILGLLPVRSAEDHQIRFRNYHQVLPAIASCVESVPTCDVGDPPHVPVPGALAIEITLVMQLHGFRYIRARDQFAPSP